MEKEKWIEEIMNSTDGKSLAQPDAYLFAKIQSRIMERDIVSPQWIWLAAASLALLCLLNAKMLLSKTKHQKAGIENVAANLSASNQLY